MHIIIIVKFIQLYFSLSTLTSKIEKGANVILGDVLCLVGAVLYASANVLAEKFASKYDIYEYLSFLGLFGSIISAIQM